MAFPNPNLLLHWPPRENAEYEREAMDALGEYELEQRVAQLDREVDQLECAAWDMECDLRINDAAALLVTAAQKRREYTRLKRELDDRETWR